MANPDNIKDKSFDKLTAEKQREIARKGGVASGKARREKADLKKAFAAVFESTTPNQKLKALLEANGIEANVLMSMIYALAIRASKGDPKAFELAMKYGGMDRLREAQIKEMQREDKPEDKVNYDSLIKALRGNAKEDWTPEEGGKDV